MRSNIYWALTYLLTLTLVATALHFDDRGGDTAQLERRIAAIEILIDQPDQGVNLNADYDGYRIATIEVAVDDLYQRLEQTTSQFQDLAGQGSLAQGITHERLTAQIVTGGTGVNQVISVQQESDNDQERWRIAEATFYDESIGGNWAYEMSDRIAAVFEDPGSNWRTQLTDVECRSHSCRVEVTKADSAPDMFDLEFTKAVADNFTEITRQHFKDGRVVLFLQQ